MTKYIAYYRVSTAKQGVSGLGLEAQREAVHRYITPEKLYTEFTEVETGTAKKSRPVLSEALKLCASTGATLLIAKLDRLTRSVAFVSALLDSKVKFVAVDFPEANELTIHILAAVAQNEAKIISQRTKAAFAAKKARGEKMGTPENLKNEHRLKGHATNKSKALANENNTRAAAYIQKLLPYGRSCNVMANQLNKANFKTSKGKEFTAMQVLRIINKMDWYFPVENLQ
jgi:DNA invertase Pin-like site-specific DNA recombinase